MGRLVKHLGDWLITYDGPTNGLHAVVDGFDIPGVVGCDIEWDVDNLPIVVVRCKVGLLNRVNEEERAEG